MKAAVEAGKTGVEFWSGAKLRAAVPTVLLIGLILTIGAIRPSFLNANTLAEIAADTATLFTLATGVTFVVIIGGIDLSIQSVASLSSVIMALLLPRYGWGAFPVALAAGLAIGVGNGFAHVGLRIPSFIATLASSGIAASIALVFSQAHSVTINETGRNFLAWISGRFLGVPTLILIGLLVAALGFWLQQYTSFGRYSVAIGAGEAAVWASGVRVGRQKIYAYALSGGLAAFAGTLLASRMSSGSPTLASELLLPAISAVVVGGTAITGGSGGIGRTLIGSLLISVIRVGMTFVGVPIFAQQIVFGMILIAAVALTLDRGKIFVVK
ncbi:MAG TPA: ABC transporter permease [Chthoniobacterales bacterium]